MTTLSKSVPRSGIRSSPVPHPSHPSPIPLVPLKGDGGRGRVGSEASPGDSGGRFGDTGTPPPQSASNSQLSLWHEDAARIDFGTGELPQHTNDPETATSWQLGAIAGTSADDPQLAAMRRELDRLWDAYQQAIHDAAAGLLAAPPGSGRVREQELRLRARQIASLTEQVRRAAQEV